MAAPSFGENVVVRMGCGLEHLDVDDPLDLSAELGTGWGSGAGSGDTGPHTPAAFHTNTTEARGPGSFYPSPTSTIGSPLIPGAEPRMACTNDLRPQLLQLPLEPSSAHQPLDLDSSLCGAFAFGGILDSPVVLPEGAWRKDQMPLSPPPTEPTSMLTLPLSQAPPTSVVASYSATKGGPNEEPRGLLEANSPHNHTRNNTRELECRDEYAEEHADRDYDFGCVFDRGYPSDLYLPPLQTFSPSSPRLRTFSASPDLPPCYSEHTSAVFEDQGVPDKDGAGSGSTDSGQGLLLLLDEEPAPYSHSPEAACSFPNGTTEEWERGSLDRERAEARGLSEMEKEEARRLVELKKKAMEAERAARAWEEEVIARIEREWGIGGKVDGPVLDPGAIRDQPAAFSPVGENGEESREGGIVDTRTTLELQRVASEARKVAKREHARVKEVAALLRLKVGNVEKRIRIRDEDGLGVFGAPAALPLVENGNTSPTASSMTSDANPACPPTDSDFDPGTPSSTSPPRPQTLSGIDFVTSPPVFTRKSKKNGRKGKKALGSIEHLVAKMILSRRETGGRSSVSGASTVRTVRPEWLFNNHGAAQDDVMLPYRQRWKFLRSSPLARTSVVASPDPPKRGSLRASSVEGGGASGVHSTVGRNRADENGESDKSAGLRSNSMDSTWSEATACSEEAWDEDLETNCGDFEHLKPIEEFGDEEGDGIGRFEEDEDEDWMKQYEEMGFEALKTPLTWGFEIGDELLPAL